MRFTSIKAIVLIQVLALVLCPSSKLSFGEVIEDWSLDNHQVNEIISIFRRSPGKSSPSTPKPSPAKSPPPPLLTLPPTKSPSPPSLPIVKSPPPLSADESPPPLSSRTTKSPPSSSSSPPPSLAKSPPSIQSPPLNAKSPPPSLADESPPTLSSRTVKSPPPLLSSPSPPPAKSPPPIQSPPPKAKPPTQQPICRPPSPQPAIQLPIRRPPPTNQPPVKSSPPPSTDYDEPPVIEPPVDFAPPIIEQPPFSQEPPYVEPPINQPPTIPFPPTLSPPSIPRIKWPIKLPPPTIHPSGKPLIVVGRVNCKSCNSKGLPSLFKASPLHGASVKLVCRNNGKKETVQSALTNKNGEFTIIPISLTSGDVQNCRVFLGKSPKPVCNVPTNFNNGKSGAILKPVRPHGPGPAPVIDFFGVGPFIFEAPKIFPCSN